MDQRPGLRADGRTLAASGTDTPAGSVQFKVDGNPIGAPVTLVNGSATSAPIATLTSITVETIRVRKGRRARKETEILVHYSGPLDAGSVQEVSSDILTQPGRDRRIGTGDDRPLRVLSARYDPATDTIALLPMGGKLKFRPALQLRLVGSGIRDAEGRPIDGGLDLTSPITRAMARTRARLARHRGS